MTGNNLFDVIIIGGSYSGLAAGMALGRALRKVLIIDSEAPCNRQTPYSHNLITHDGTEPKVIADTARRQVEKYDTIQILKGVAKTGVQIEKGFEIHTTSEVFRAKKLVFASGIKDIMPDISGFAVCWGISVLHCPFCHGYEVRNQKTGILGNGESGFEFSALISNWTDDLTLYTNGHSTLTNEQTLKLKKHRIDIVEAEIDELEQKNGYLQSIRFKDGKKVVIKTIYARVPFVQHCTIPESLGCKLNGDGYIEVDPSQKTSVHGIFCCGDNTSRIRTVANAVGMGTTTGIMVNKELTEENF